jgi:glucose-6-phosphate isomerase
MADALSAAWAEIERLGARPEAGAIRPLFVADPQRFARFSRRAGSLLLDYSKTALSDEVLSALLALARAADVEGRRAAMARGEAVNATEHRAVLHIALRGHRGVLEAAHDVAEVLGRMRAFTEATHREGRFTDVLNIGIGGSDLGPAMVARALWRPGCPLEPHYLGNVDGHAWEALRPRLDPARTLVLVASKTFTTQETMTNAALVRAWLGEHAARNMAALSTNLEATAAFGIPEERVFPFKDWVGGRFSLWSAIGLSLALALGWDSFARLLDGARVMDEHFLSAPLADNLPVLLALVECWHVNARGLTTRAVLPYDERLARLPAHLQQVEMESLGKRVTLTGEPVRRMTGAVVFGEPGTNAQHSFMQLIHQSPRPVPVDFILVAKPDHPYADSHRKLLANGLAQAEALLRGKSRAEAADETPALAAHREFPGDRPSVTILLPHLDAHTLGQLVALYEHKVFTLGALWGVNAFDQWGVELGKHLASAILPELEAGASKPGAHDSSTEGLMRELLRLQST